MIVIEGSRVSKYSLYCYFLAITGSILHYLPRFMGLQLYLNEYENVFMTPLSKGLQSKSFNSCVAISIGSSIPIFLDFLFDKLADTTQRQHPAKAAIWFVLLSSLMPNILLFAYIIPNEGVEYWPSTISLDSTILATTGCVLFNAYGSSIFTWNWMFVVQISVNIAQIMNSFLPFFNPNIQLDAAGMSFRIVSFAGASIICMVLNSRHVRAILELEKKINDADGGGDSTVSLVEDLQGSCQSAVDILNDLLVYESLSGNSNNDLATTTMKITMKMTHGFSFLKQKINALTVQAQVIRETQSQSQGQSEYSLRISVHDNGPEILESDRNSIFQNHLVFTAGILQTRELHKGRLYLESLNESSGNTFIIEIPIVEFTNRVPNIPSPTKRSFVGCIFDKPVSNVVDNEKHSSSRSIKSPIRNICPPFLKQKSNQIYINGDDHDDEDTSDVVSGMLLATFLLRWHWLVLTPSQVLTALPLMPVKSTYNALFQANICHIIGLLIGGYELLHGSVVLALGGFSSLSVGRILFSIKRWVRRSERLLKTREGVDRSGTSDRLL
eukprot:gene11410-23869_t